MTTLRNLLLAFSILNSINLAAPHGKVVAQSNDNQTQTAEFETLLAAAKDLYRERKYDEALSNCLKAGTLNPQSHRSYVCAGEVYMRMARMKSASEAFASAIQVKPAAKELYLLKATADGSRFKLDEAVAECRRALEIDPTYAEAYLKMGDVLRWKKERSAEAVAAYEAALKLNPRLFSAYEDLGQIALRDENEKGAEELFRKAMATDPAHMSGRFALGRLLIKHDRLTDARELWEGRSSDKDSISPKFVDLLTRAENLNRASEDLAQKPNDPDALIAMGLAVMDGEHWVFDGRQKRAIVYFKKALDLRPNDKRAQYNIVKGYIEIAFMFRDQNKIVDEELKKLKKLDKGLAREMEEYRKNYVGGLTGNPVDVNR